LLKIPLQYDEFRIFLSPPVTRTFKNWGDMSPPPPSSYGGAALGHMASAELKAFTFMSAKFCMNIRVFNDFQQYLCHKMAKKPAITTDVTLVVETLSPTSQCKTKQTKA
jgi:hypothetical protein